MPPGLARRHFAGLMEEGGPRAPHPSRPLRPTGQSGRCPAGVGALANPDPLLRPRNPHQNPALLSVRSD